MSKFYVGQRVKIVDGPGIPSDKKYLVGRETHITGPSVLHVGRVFWPIAGLPEDYMGIAYEGVLVPLTDPTAYEHFMAQVLKPVPLNIPQTEKIK